jgi:PTS system glucitol/sorbitol-specific IIA component
MISLLPDYLCSKEEAMNKYVSTVIAIGDMVEALLQQGMMVLFDETAPMELKEISIIHTGGPLAKEVKNGDFLVLGNLTYTITAVGEIANKNLKNIGHVCLKFDARTLPELPGDIHLKGEKLPLIIVGDTITIKGQ